MMVLLESFLLLLRRQLALLVSSLVSLFWGLLADYFDSDTVYVYPFLTAAFHYCYWVAFLPQKLQSLLCLECFPIRCLVL